MKTKGKEPGTLKSSKSTKAQGKITKEKGSMSETATKSIKSSTQRQTLNLLKPREIWNPKRRIVNNCSIKASHDIKKRFDSPNKKIFSRKDRLESFIISNLETKSQQNSQQLVLLQVKHDDNLELAFKFGNKTMVIGIMDFALITGLNCRSETSGKKITRLTVSIFEKYFEEKPVTLGALQHIFEARTEILAQAPDKDVVRMANLYSIEKLIVSNQNKL